MKKTKFRISAILCFGNYADETHTYDQTLKMGFSDSRDLKKCKPSKCQFRIFESKRILFISYTDKRK